MIKELFPTPIGFYSLDRGINQAEEKFVAEQFFVSNSGNSRSVNTQILDSTEMVDLKEFIESCINDYFESVYCPINDVKPYITQSWLNLAKEGDFHQNHSHPNSFISGVLYISAEEDVDKISFINSNYRQITIPPKEWNQYNSNTWWYSVKACDLILFPSSLVHMVTAKEGANTRISLAFNTFLKGSLGSIDDLTKLDL